MKVVFLGLEFFINNLGCEALSYAFSNELYNIALEQGKELEIVTVVFADLRPPFIPNTNKAIRCIKIRYKSFSFWKKIRKEFITADLVFDFTMGDSFSDIYGLKRFVLDALVKSVALKSKVRYILGPQTYGPYRNRFVKKWAKWILCHAEKVYARDEQSQKVASDLSGREIVLTTDVAFALPCVKQNIENNSKIKVGFNPSGLLWAGGYTGNNQFSLSIDYQEYCWTVCKWLAENSNNYEVFLIPHVGTVSRNDSGAENDCTICVKIHQKYPQMKILDDINTPMDIKGYLAAMDVFIGARMHATIGAFSSGVATIPVSYSRKFEGLYGSLDYDYVIHALKSSTEEAVKQTIEYIENYRALEAAVGKSMAIVEKKQQVFRDEVRKIIEGN